MSDSRYVSSHTTEHMHTMVELTVILRSLHQIFEEYIYPIDGNSGKEIDQSQDANHFLIEEERVSLRRKLYC